MKRYAALLLILGFSLTLGAQDIFESPLTEETRDGVRSVFTELASHDRMRADYTQSKFIASLKRELPGSGVFLFDEAKGMAWIVERPFPMELVISDREIIQRSPSGQTQVLSFEDNPSFHGFADTVQSIFRGDLEEVEEEYSLFFRRTGESWHMALVPRDATMAALISSFQLKGGQDLEEFAIDESSGDKITYRFTNIEYPAYFGDEEKRVLP